MDEGKWLDDFHDSMKRAGKNNDERKAEFDKLCADPCMKRAQVGDRVIVAVGLIGHGWNWMREECVVVEVGDVSVKVRLTRLKPVSNDPYEHWIAPNLITDVLPAKANPDA